jgi:hypothetical protein
MKLYYWTYHRPESPNHLKIKEIDSSDLEWWGKESSGPDTDTPFDPEIHNIIEVAGHEYELGDGLALTREEAKAQIIDWGKKRVEYAKDGYQEALYRAGRIVIEANELIQAAEREMKNV